MRLLRISFLVVNTVVIASAASAQSSTSPGPGQNPPPPSRPVALFPAEARFAFIDFQQVASKSAPGKLAARILKEFSDKKLSELDAKDKQLQALAGKRDTAVLTGPAATQIARDVARLQREVEFARQSAQAEFQQIRTDLEADLQLKVTPVVAEIAKERNLHAVFSADSSLLYVLPALDISDEVVKRLDAEPKKSARD